MLKMAGQLPWKLLLQEERATREATETQLAAAVHEAEEATASAQQQATQQLADEVSPISFCTVSQAHQAHAQLYCCRLCSLMGRVIELH